MDGLPCQCLEKGNKCPATVTPVLEDTNSIGCDSCLYWQHWRCVAVKAKPKPKFLVFLFIVYVFFGLTLCHICIPHTYIIVFYVDICLLLDS